MRYGGEYLSLGSVSHEGFEIDEFCHGGMSGFEDDLGSLAGLFSFLPAEEAETPTVTWFKSGELVFGPGGGEVISLLFTVG